MMNVFEDCESAKHVAIWYHHKKEKVINQKIRTYIKDVGEMPDEAYTRRQTDEKNCRQEVTRYAEREEYQHTGSHFHGRISK